MPLALGLAFGLVSYAPAEETDSKAEAQAGWTLVTIQIVDIETGSVTPNQDLVIMDGRIAWRGDMDQSPIETADQVDVCNRFIMPGLWDSHGQSFDLCPISRVPIT